MLDDDIINELGRNTIYNLSPLPYLLYITYRRKFLKKFFGVSENDFCDTNMKLNLTYLDEDCSEIMMEDYAEMEFSNQDILYMLADRCNMKLFISESYNYPEDDTLMELRKKIQDIFPTLSETVINENFVGCLSDIDYAQGIILNDCDYELKRQIFLSKHSQSEVNCYEEYFEYPFNGFWDCKRLIIDGEEFIFVILGTCGSCMTGFCDLDLNFVQKKIEFQQELE